MSNRQASISNSHRPIPAPRPVGTAIAMITALAAACVLAACGPDDVTDVAAKAPLSLSSEAVLPKQPVRTERVQPGSQAAVVSPAGAFHGVADRNGQAAPRALYGQISSIEPIHSSPRTNGTGAVVGGVLGAVVGNQIGSGNGRAAATILGGVGGAVVGNKVEKSRSENVTGYRVHIQLENGNTRSFERTTLNGLDVGDRVRVDGNRLREV